MLARALEERQPDARWVTRGSGNAHLLTDPAGERLLGIDAEAEALLMRSHLLAQNIGMTRRQRVPPAFVRTLALKLSAASSACYVAPVANGRVVAEARRTTWINEESGEQTITYIALREETSFAACCIDYLMDQSLSPLQRDLALFGMKGGPRADCPARFGISTEALKKHSAAIIGVLGIDRWADLNSLGSNIAQGIVKAGTLSTEF